VTGILVPPNDPNALANAIATGARDPALRARLGAAAADRVNREFDHRTTTRRLITLFERMAGHRHPNREAA
jgi:glycosyltransferase involved in cell wall biosynthesis